MNLNKVFLIGRLTQDPQLRSTQSGTSVATFSIATNRVWVNKQGGKEQDVQYHNIVVWGRQAEIVNQFLRKGSMVMVEGRLQTRTWADNQGQNHKTTEVISERVQFGPKSDSRGVRTNFESQGQASVGEESQAAKEELPEINLEEDEIKPEDVPF